MAVLVVKHFLKPVAFENDDHENRQEKGDQQVCKPEDQQSRQHLSIWHLRHGADEEPFKNAQAAWRAGPERGAKREEEYPEDDEIAGIAGLRQSEIDYSSGCEDFEGRRQQLPSGDFRFRIFQLKTPNYQWLKSKNGTDHIDSDSAEENHAHQPGGRFIGEKSKICRQQPAEAA